MEKIVWQSISKSRHGPIFICLRLNAYCPFFIVVHFKKNNENLPVFYYLLTESKNKESKKKKTNL